MHSQTPNIVQLQQDYQAGFERLGGDVAGRLAHQHYLNGSTAIYHGDVIGSCFLPKLWDMPTLTALNELATTTYTILQKAAEHFCSDPAYRALFGFSPLLDYLICLPTGYDCVIPITRIDLFLDENTLDFKFCEFNTDGTSAMNEDREIVNGLALTESFCLAGRHQRIEPQELFDPWVEQFLALYASTPQAVAHPTIGIVDYTKSATIHEFEEFRRRFERRGYTCVISDITQLRYHDGALYGTDVNPEHPAYGTAHRLDAVYRRGVTAEILLELEAEPLEALDALRGGMRPNHTLQGALALAHAVRDNAVGMLGGFVTQIAHCKQIFSILHLPQTAEFLTEEERAFVRRHVPYTTTLCNEDIDLAAVLGDKNNWIIKPKDGYGSVGVFAGRDQTQEEWEALVHNHSDGRYVIQTYCTQYQTLNTRPVPLEADGSPRFNTPEEAQAAQEEGSFDPLALEPWSILTGLYLYGGTFSGVYVRAGQSALIVGFQGGVALGSYLVDYDARAGLALRTR